MTIEVYDFFAGVGGTSAGLREAGMNIKLALDFDKSAIESFKQNFPDAHALHADITSISAEEIAAQVNTNNVKLFCGCAPCQPFSQQNGNRSINDPRIDLLSHFGRFIEYYLPEYVLVENVPGLQKVSRSGPLPDFIEKLNNLNYQCTISVLSSRDYGVPQKRDRLVVLASRHDTPLLPTPTHGKGTENPYTTVRDWISGFPPLNAGDIDKLDKDHQAAKLSEINLQRIKHTPEGGDRDSWPKELINECHKNYNGHKDVYGRLAWDKQAAGITTKCTSYSNGRFGHPEQNRAISLREAACLQTFPRNFKFSGSLTNRAKQVGNAVPPLLAKHLGQAIISQHESLINNQR